MARAIRKATLLVLILSLAAQVGYVVWQCWHASADDILHGAPYFLWMFSPYACAIPLLMLQRKTLGPSLTALVGSLLISGFGSYVLAAVTWASIARGDNESGLALFVVPFYQWPAFLITAAIAFLVAGRLFRRQAALVLVAAVIVSVVVCLYLSAFPDYGKHEAMLRSTRVVGALAIVILLFLLIRLRPRRKEAKA